ncbi:unnamed protein product [Caenorhabditis bovis]|uniref:SUN domain-containing protein n=1 Tax=Caenorhabditis bovis TaxID=2654633 RepID=A0A8S1FBR4_9PELO|nr:unnamed protein product [Caenorhabditis bovis]
MNELSNRQKDMKEDFEEANKLFNSKLKLLDDYVEKTHKLEQSVNHQQQQIENVQHQRIQTSHVIYHEPEISVLETTPIRQKTIDVRPPGVNVANSLLGATIDQSCSSRTVSSRDGLLFDMLSYFINFKSGYVLLDREVLTPGETWCTYDAKPTLTINLARFVHPTAVSYQHVKWSGIIPNYAPKIYDVVACHSPCCTEFTPVALNCRYETSEDGEDIQEQFCHVTVSVHLEPINRVQFRFRENQGNITKTCAYLVRVYGHVAENPKQDSVQTETEQSKSAIHNYMPSFDYFTTE